MSGFRVVREREIDPPAPPPPAPPAPPAPPTEVSKQNTAMLLLALRALSQRTLTALTNGFSLLLVMSVWALCWHVLSDPNPSSQQLVICGLYALFTLAVDIVRRRTPA